MADIWGRREAESASFSPGAMDKLVRKVKGCTSESFLELLRRGLRTRGEIWPPGAGRGGAGGPGAWGGGGLSLERQEPGRRASRQPSLLAGLRAVAQTLFCQRAHSLACLAGRAP